MAQGEYTSNAASSTLQGAATGAAMGSVVPGIGTVGGAIVGGLIGLGKGLVENSASKKRARKVQKQKDRLKDAKNKIKGTLQTIPDIFQESQNIQEQQIDKESQSIVENFIEMIDYDTERQKTAAIQGILSEMYDIDTTIESL
jgi:phage tail tape-measure protein